MKALLLILSLAITPLTFGEDIRDKVATGSPEKAEKSLIDPNNTILGLKVGSSEEEVLEKLGPPQGYLRLNEINTAAIYDQIYAYIFTEGKLSGIRISESLIDQDLITKFSRDRFYGRGNWILDNGIKPEMSLASIRDLIGDSLQSPLDNPGKHVQYYEDEGTIVFLYFAHYMRGGDSDESYSLHGIMVIPKS